MIFIFGTLLFFSCDESNDPLDIQTFTESSEVEDLQIEVRDLQYLKEEEKLARDVYLYSYDLYGLNIFKNISNSEQMHMNSVTEILIKYQIEDLSFEERGKFSNVFLQQLYDDLTNLADKSLTDALVAGATIEDLDINDLDEFIFNNTYEDIEDMYELLSCGSRNHLRAYIGSLNNFNFTYKPQFISVEEFESIIYNSNEICNN
jgi:hypothetical protein